MKEWEIQSRTYVLHPHLQITYFCCPGCGLRFEETLTYVSNTVHDCPANPGVKTFVPSPRKLEEKMKKTICSFCNKRKAVEIHETDTVFMTIYSCRNKECMIKAEEKAIGWGR